MVPPLKYCEVTAQPNDAIREWSHEYTNWDPQRPGAIRVFMPDSWMATLPHETA
ncbi:MAG: hypothetical protein Kow0063_16350 [Anaerolineae bacterium]